MNNLPVKVQVLRPDFLPQYKTDGSAGLDLHADIDNTAFIRPDEVIKVSTGLKVYLEDPGYAGIVIPRSGLGTSGLVLGNLVGLLDSDYQGPLTLALWNRTQEPILIHAGDRVAQLFVVPVAKVTWDVVDGFEVTARGEGGFGSTGSS